MKFSIATLFVAATVATPATALTFDTGSVDGNSVSDLKLVNRIYVPYGPDLTTDPPQASDGTLWAGYGYGMAAAEHAAYDPKEGYLYVQGEAGPYITILDYYSFPPSVTTFGLDLGSYDSEMKDVAVCPEKQLLFVTALDANKVLMFRTVTRDNQGKPELLKEIDAGKLPDVLLLNSDCSMLAVTNENEGDALNEGAIHLISNFEENGAPTVRKVRFNAFTDDYLLGRNVHMPLTQKAMEYWDLYSNIAADIDWTTVRAQYNPGLFMEPEFMAFTDDGKQLFVNLQENSALLRIDVETGLARSVDGYGLKSWATSANNEGIDIIKDDGCSELVQNDALHSVRAPDGMALVTIDGEHYVLIAEEGDDKDYGQYEEKREAGELFAGTTITEASFTAPEDFFNFTSSSNGFSSHFNSDCEANGISWCADSAEISIGSSAVDYETDPQNPVMSKVVLFGGRGISIFKVPSSYEDPIDFVWESGSEFEKEGCAAYPWAHNGIQDEAFAPVGGALWELSDTDDQTDIESMNDPLFDGCDDAGNGQPGACPMSTTVDEKSPEDGPAPESVTVGVACGRLVAVACGENNSVCFLYDITDIQNPKLEKVFNLSPESENKAPGVAYDERVLGEHDPETSIFVDPVDSPTGKAGILFFGALSGTISFYEFECTIPVDRLERPALGTGGTDDSGDDSGLSGGAIAGIAIGGAALIVALLAFFILRKPTTETIILDGHKTSHTETA